MAMMENFVCNAATKPTTTRSIVYTAPVTTPDNQVQGESRYIGYRVLELIHLP